MGMDDSSQMTQIPKPQIIIDELLCSTVNAIQTGKLDKDILPTFVNFYDPATVKDAKQKLVTLGLLPSRSSRQVKDGKQKDISEILDCLRKQDWKSTALKFAALDLDLTCRAPAGVGDDILLRYEINTIKNQFTGLLEDLEDFKNTATEFQAVTTEMKGIVNGLQVNLIDNTKNLATDMKKVCQELTTASQREERPSYLKVLTSTANLTPLTPTYEQNAETPQFPPRDSNLFSNNWKTVVKRKQPRKTLRSKREAVGKSADSSFRGVKQIKKGILFITRCPPNTTDDDVKSSIANKATNNFDLLSVESMTTKFNTYKSFKVTFDRKDSSLNHFFDTMINAEIWPEGILVKPFMIRHHAARGESLLKRQ